MALTLPASPTLNQTYTQGTKTWIWNGTTWKASGGISTTVGLTAPTSPSDGTMWYDTSDGTLYIRTGSIWVEAVVAAAGASANPLPTGNTAQRPGSPTVGNMRINSETNYVEVYYSSSWFNLTYIGLLTATSTNATVTYSGNYAIHTFLTSGTFTPTYVPVGGTVEYLIIAGGGSGGGSTAGGGGAGGYLTQAGWAVSATAYTIIVGTGGPGVGQQTAANDGTNSTAFGLTALGGGGGGYSYSGGGGAAGRAGGSGGGGQSYTAGYTAGGVASLGGSQGFSGGVGASDYSGGGGGAGMVGYNATGAKGGNGGAGLPSAINGTTVYRAGGGGGATNGATGGLGGGGAGAGGATGTAGTVNTGGGGGGGWDYSGGSGGAGGSGIVIIRYRYQ